MKKSRIFSILLTVIVSIPMLLSGCGGAAPSVQSPSTQPSSSGSATPKAENSPETLPPVELKWYLLNWGGPQSDTDLVFEEISKITKEKINATVKGEFIGSGDYTDKMNVKIQSGEQFDISFTCSWALDYYSNARKGAFADITDLLPEYAPEAMSIIDPKFIEGAKIDGRIYAIPTNKEISAQLVYEVNVAMCEKYGIDYKTEFAKITNLADFEPYFEKVKAGEGNDFVPLVLDEFAQSFVPIDMISSKFGTYFDMNDDNKNKSLTIINQIEMPETMEICKTMRNFYNKGYLMKDVNITANTAAQKDALKKNGKWLVRPNGYYPLNELQATAEAGYTVDVVKAFRPYVPTWSTTGAMQAISATSKNKERALMFLNLVNTDQKLRNLVGSGIEGTHFTLEGDIMTQTEQGKNAYQTWNIGIANPIGLLYRVVGEPENKWDAFKEYNEAGIPTPTFGFVFDQTPVKDEIAALNNVIKEFNSIVFTGSVDPEVYLPKYIEKMKEQGSQKVIDEMQTQLDAWLATNKK